MTTHSHTNSFSHINNHDRFHQKADFSNVLLAGTDVDFITEIGNQLYVAVEWKMAGNGMPAGQALCFQRLVRDLGKVKPVFHVVAHHNTQPSDPIDGDNSFVAQVLYRLPNMTRGAEYIYEDDAPSLNQWMGDLSYEWKIKKVLRFGPVPLWEGIPQVDTETWDRVSQPKGPSAFFDHIRPISDAYRQ